ncbi:alpha/beta hydrolase [Aurantiacibacter marinus]|uniref:Alpha/beta hydrolase n=1 Tax=Aurantiacibacter marinus TaxID=874156 RepID=A0A0H0XRC4_9SPHN|nr:alpha/beta hydrolase [Aurantiacibacter marinus]KLI62800.1 alpha/beta hydrolase [Aurantiacibacter marinus]
MKFVLAGIPVLALAGVAISYFISPLHTFNTLVPKDSDSRLAAEGVAYGDNARQQLDIYVPEGAANGPRPVIVWFYGGSWNSGSREGYAFAGRALAARGFVTVVADYRLVPEVRFPGFVEDGAAAVRWVRANIGEYGGDGDRIVLAGHSAGAYIGAMLANDPQWLGDDRAAVAGFAGLAGPYDFYPFDTSSTVEAFGQWPDGAETQPVTFADGSAPPALLLTGTDDTTVKPRNSEALTARLGEAGVEAELIHYAEVDHIDIVIALARPLRGRAPVLDDMAGFAARVTAPAQ